MTYRNSRTRLSAFCSVASLSAALMAAPALAQPPADDAVSSDAEIVVTGTRLRDTALTAATPLTLVSEAAIERTGQTNISETLRRNPIFSTGVSGGNTNFNVDGNGLNLLDLRGLGVQRTLVLINGKRVVQGGLGPTGGVDINMVPTDLVKRVEVTTGGASAIYGSEAMAGVVNFVLDDHFEGIDARAQVGMSSRRDAQKYRLSATLGTNFAGGRGNVWINGVYDGDRGLLSSERPFSANDVFGRSSFAPQGSFNLNGSIFDITTPGGPNGNEYANDYTFARDGSLKQGFVQNIDGFNRNGLRRLTVPIDRYLGNIGFNYEFSDSVKLYVYGQYGHTKSQSQIEPYPMGGGDPAIDGSGSIDVIGGLKIDNAYIPAGIAAAIAARNSDLDPTNDVSFIAFRRRLSDVFDRSNRNERDFYRAVVGLKGGAFSDWNYDVSYVFGQTRDKTASDTITLDRISFALDAVDIGGNIVCRDATARANGCQPLNIFGANTASQAAVNYIKAGGALASELRRKVEQHDVTATIDGTLFHLPAGAVRASFGVEYRHESAKDDWDANTNSGNTLGNFLSDTSGSYDVKSVFGETSIPILADQPFAKYLGVRGAVRFDDYSTIGSVLSWQAGAEWAPSSDIRLRAMYSTASRAPSIHELYSAQSETFPGTTTLDPCNGVTANSTGTYDAACRGIPGVAQQIANSGAFVYSTAQIQSVNGFDGGNPNLKEETANTWTVGAVMTPSFLPGVTLTADWYHIEVKGAINSAPREDTVKECLLNPGGAACALVQRLPSGYLTRVDAVNANTGGFLTSGIDIVARYEQTIGGFGTLGFQGNWTHLLEHKRKPSDAAAYIDELGQLQDANGERLGSGFVDRFSITTVATTGPFELSWTARYYSPIKDTLDPNTAPDPEVNNVPSKFYNDFQVRVTVSDEAHTNRKLELYAGIDNAFDIPPPILANGATASGLIGAETAQEYDFFGRYFYVGAKVKF